MRLSESGLVKRGPPWIRPKNHSKYVKKRSCAGAPHLALMSIYGDRPFDSAFGAGEARRLGVSASVATASGALPRAAGGEVASGPKFQSWLPRRGGSKVPGGEVSCGVVAADAPFQSKVPDFWSRMRPSRLSRMGYPDMSRMTATSPRPRTKFAQDAF